MARNTGNGHRVGAVRGRSQTFLVIHDVDIWPPGHKKA